MKVSTGAAVSSFYDPLIAKVIVEGHSREAVISKLARILGYKSFEDESADEESQRVVVQGPPNNIPFLCQLLNEGIFKEGRATTQWIDAGGVNFIPRYEFYYGFS